MVRHAIDETRLIALAGNTRREAITANDRGRVPDDFRMEHVLLQLKRSPMQERALEVLIDELHNPASPNFHKWLTANEFGRRFGLADSDLNVITGWLSAHCLAINVVYPNRLLIDFSGTAGLIRETFHTEIHRLVVNGAEHIANITDPQVPAALAPAIVGLVSLNDFVPQPLHDPHAGYTLASEESTQYDVAPGDLATIYNLTPLFSAGIDGEGQTIAVIEAMDLYEPSDWDTFRDIFGLSAYTTGSLKTIHPPPPSGSNNCVAPGFIGTDAEVIADAEWASAAAPGAAIEVVSCSSSNGVFGVLIAVQNLINGGGKLPDIISISYGISEAENGAAANAAYSSAYQQAVSQGISIFVASGDSGATFNNSSGLAVNGLASTAYNVAVGGTDFSDTYSGQNDSYWKPVNGSGYESAQSYIPEIPWNDTCASLLIANSHGYKVTYGSDGYCAHSSAKGLSSSRAASGGPSNCASLAGKKCVGTAKPSWQAGFIGIPSDGVRDLPDISAFAGRGVWGHEYVYCDSADAPCTPHPATWSYDGGTSFGAPVMAGIQALVNQKMGQRQGNPNYVYYPLASSDYGTAGNDSCYSSKGNQVSEKCTFHDVTGGDMDVPCTGVQSCFMPSGTTGVLSISSGKYDPAYRANIGWDFATGIGTVNAYNLVNNWGTVISKAGERAGRH